jgi:Arc/MetJ family transcription regulator
MSSHPPQDRAGIAVDPEVVTSVRRRLGDNVDDATVAAYVTEAVRERLARERHRMALLMAKAANADEGRVERMMASVERQGR